MGFRAVAAAAGHGAQTTPLTPRIEVGPAPHWPALNRPLPAPAAPGS
jgi:hypothetical protein